MRGGQEEAAERRQPERRYLEWAGKEVGEAPPLPELRHRELPPALPAPAPLPAGGGARTVSRESRGAMAVSRR